MKVVCVAVDPEALDRLKRAAVGAVWELTPGATDRGEALSQVEEEKAHVLVIGGEFDDLAGEAKTLRATLRVVADRPAPGVDAVFDSLDEVRDAISGLPKPGGPVRA